MIIIRNLIINSDNIIFYTEVGKAILNQIIFNKSNLNKKLLIRTFKIPFTDSFDLHNKKKINDSSIHAINYFIFFVKGKSPSRK